jgi:hypothetical protein
MRFSTTTFVATFAASATAYSANGRTFAVNHFYGNGPLVMGRMDPIVSPGVASGHVHAVQGGNAFALTMTDDQALGSTCTSSLVKNDKSNYWTPSLYFVDPKNGSIESVDMFYMNVYYFFEATTDTIKAFQPGHRMVVGNPELRTPPATGGKSILDLSDGTPQPVQFTCPRSNTAQPLYPVDSDGLHGVGIQDPGNAGAGVGFPDQNCDGYASPLRADIHFPSCYNPAEGLDAYKTNMQFPTNGNCPSGWIHTPHLFYEVYWNTPLFADRWTPGQGTQPFVLSNGDPTGYSLHADFISGWDVETLQQIIDNCDAGDSGMDKCPNLIGGLNDPSTSCNIESAIVEDISGVLEKLPGNNPIGQWGVSPAPAASAGPSAATISTPQTSAALVYTPETSASPIVSASSTTEIKTVAADAATGVSSAAKPVSTAKEATAEPQTYPAPTYAASNPNPATMVTSYVTTTTNIYTTVTLPQPSPSASAAIVAPGWSYYGCYSDNSNRVLTGMEFVNLNHKVDNTDCTEACNAAGFSFAGTEYGGQCFCGNSLNGSSKEDESTCNMPCEGDATQTCGGGWRLSVYSKSSSTKRSMRHFHNHQVRGNRH